MSYPTGSKKERFSTWGGPQTGPKEETEGEQIDVEDPGRKKLCTELFPFYDEKHTDWARELSVGQNSARDCKRAQLHNQGDSNLNIYSSNS